MISLRLLLLLLHFLFHLLFLHLLLLPYVKVLVLVLVLMASIGKNQYPILLVTQSQITIILLGPGRETTLYNQIKSNQMVYFPNINHNTQYTSRVQWGRTILKPKASIVGFRFSFSHLLLTGLFLLALLLHVSKFRVNKYVNK